MSTESKRRFHPFHVVLAASLALNVVFIANLGKGGTSASDESQATATANPPRAQDRVQSFVPRAPSFAPPAPSAPAAREPSWTITHAARDPQPATPEPTADANGDGAYASDGDAVQRPLRMVRANVERNIPHSFRQVVPDISDALGQVYARNFVWDLTMQRDLRAGDTLAVVFEEPPQGEIIVHAATLASQRYGRTFEAFRFQATGDPFPSYWTADGTEVPRRLNNSPIEAYEQITSLLRDRPNHHGIDFKAPVGTPITSPFAGTVLRTNWNAAANGTCIEIQYHDGMVGKFLHLSENRVAVGDQVTAGQVIALSGNTGNSTGPHLHYQLNQGASGAVLDPVDVHGTYRRQLSDADRQRFQDVVTQMRARLEGVDVRH